MTADKPTLKLPPRLGVRERGADPVAAPGEGPAARPGVPRLAVGSAPPPAASPPQAVPKRSEVAPPGGGAGPRPSLPPAPGGAAGASVPASGGPRAVAPARGAPRKTGEAPVADARREGRRSTGIAPSRLAQEMRPPTGTVTSCHAVAEVMRAARELAAVLVEENAVLRDHDVDGVRALADRKKALSLLYRERMLAVQKDPEVVTGLPEDERAVVRQMGVYLDAQLAENASLLKATMQGTQKVMDLMVQAAKQLTQEKNPGYAADGRPEPPGHAKAPLAMSFNETL
ncbi:hypothetical protein [Roseospira visakhapatnamensis]|uniref:FlgN protein n=1 Tax=Roseospira visakhapatnamensis TaxID=390880 RepID=A0A7W6RAT3_9PROT|nr:hypothetical protein [Roseospira visakhapatnamensis]MBB4264433.1 hypothetical protein [Roseospira visakhapatnamensis]